MTAATPDDAPTSAPDDAPPPRPERSTVGRALMLVVAGLAVPAIGLVIVTRSCSRAMVSGEVAVVGARGWREPLNRCRSGELASFTGVELGRDRDGKMLVRIVDDPDRGLRFELTPPDDAPSLVLDAAGCPGLRLVLRRVGADRDGAALLDGNATARCTIDGRVVSVDAWWRRCGPE